MPARRAPPVAVSGHIDMTGRPGPGVASGAPGHADLPVRYHTPARWVAEVLAAPAALLADHAHLERKAASNALELIARWPAGTDGGRWAGILASIAGDEAAHLKAVTRQLVARGGSLPRAHRNPYASELHGLVRRGDGPRELLDRLLVAALIEVRSCERFELLAARGADVALARFFGGLCASERGHYKVFLHLAEQAAPVDECRARWDELLDAEAVIIAAQPPGPRIHSGLSGAA